MDPIIQQITSTLGNLFQGGLGGNVQVHTINASQFQNQNANNNSTNSSTANSGNSNSDMEYSIIVCE